MPSVFSDEAFQHSLTALLCRDIGILKSVGHLLTADDFKPVKGHRHGNLRWPIAGIALTYYHKHHQPIGLLLKSAVVDHVNRNHLGPRQEKDLLEYAGRLLKAEVPGVEYLLSHVIQFKKEVAKASAVEELISLQAQGKLSDDRWMDICRKAVATDAANRLQISEYFRSIRARVEARSGNPASREPMLLIEPLDCQVRSIGRGQLGLVLAPYKAGKSAMLQWITVAYSLQRLNCIYVTLEDPLSEVERRLDSITTNIPLERLWDSPRKTLRKFRQFSRLVSSDLRIVDGTEGGMTVARIEEEFLRLRESGFLADALLIDYDDEIVPSTKKPERRFELADIYRDLRVLASKYNLLLWTAAQTQRDTAHLKIISGDKVAEDISKIRKVAMAVGIGKGDWGPDSKYLWVAAHKFDRQHVGCTIVSDMRRALFYDREKTYARQRKMAAEEYKDGEGE